MLLRFQIGRWALCSPSVWLGSLAILAFAGTAPAATIAHWRFEPGNLTVDSSGNGHSLLNTGVTSSGDVSPTAQGSGSANFDGTHSQFSTASALDLSGESQLTIEWFMKSPSNTFQMIFEHSPDQTANDGAFTGQLNPAFGGAGTIGFTNKVPGSNYYRDETPVVSGGLNTWHHYAIQIDTATNNVGANDRIRIFVDGVLVSLDDDFGSPTSTTTALLNDTLFIGSRNNSSFKFTGQLDEFRISSGLLDPSQFLNAAIPVPEPSTGLLAMLGCWTIIIRRRHS